MLHVLSVFRTGGPQPTSEFVLRAPETNMLATQKMTCRRPQAAAQSLPYGLLLGQSGLVLGCRHRGEQRAVGCEFLTPRFVPVRKVLRYHIECHMRMSHEVFQILIKNIC